MKKISIEDLKAKAARYRNFYPEKYAGFDDADILLTIHAIDHRIANIVRGIVEPKTIKKGKTCIKTPKPVNAYGVVMTEARMKKEMKAAAKDYLSDNPDGDIGEVAYDMAASMLTFDMSHYGKILTKMGVAKKNHIEALAEYIVG